MKKRSWILALVIVLALYQTSCSRSGNRSGLLSGATSVNCEGSLGSFDVYVIPIPNQPQMFYISIMPVSLEDGPGDEVTVSIGSSQPSMFLSPKWCLLEVKWTRLRYPIQHLRAPRTWESYRISQASIL